MILDRLINYSWGSQTLQKLYSQNFFCSFSSYTNPHEDSQFTSLKLIHNICNCVSSDTMCPKITFREISVQSLELKSKATKRLKTWENSLSQPQTASQIHKVEIRTFKVIQSLQSLDRTIGEHCRRARFKLCKITWSISFTCGVPGKFPKTLTNIYWARDIMIRNTFMYISKFPNLPHFSKGTPLRKENKRFLRIFVPIFCWCQQINKQIGVFKKLIFCTF